MRRSTIIVLCAAISVLLLLMACSGGSSNSPSSPPAFGNVNAIISDDATQDWATIGVKVLSIQLVPQGGGTPATIYGPLTSANAPFVNLVQLDQIGEIIGNASIQTGTYTQAIITVSGNPSDILLTSAPDPEAGFPLAGGTQVPSSQIQVIGASGSPLTVPVTVNLSPALAVGSGSNALDLEFDLSHPAFLVEHVSATGTFWAVNFNPMLRHHPIRDITQLVLRHLYGTNIAVSSDDTSFTMNKIFLPVPAPATVTNSSVAASTASVQILADNNNFTGNNGTIFWNLDPSPQRSVITSFASVASILSQPGEFVRVQARYQQNGTLVAVRVWASTSFSKVFVSPEGHVLSVDRITTPATPTFTIVTENGTASPAITVNSGTEILFNGTPVSTDGATFLTANTFNFVSGFKVHVNPVDPTVTPLVADTVNIEIARYAGSISGASPTGFTYNRAFPAHTSDNYTINLDYICSPGESCVTATNPATPNGEDNSGNAITGFKWWDFAQPTSTLDYFNGTSNPITDFVSAVNAPSGLLSYGASCVPAGFTTAITPTPQPVVGESYAAWNDPADPNGAWSAQWAVLLPTPAPLATVTGVPGAGGTSFTLTPVTKGGVCTPVTVDLDTISGQATLVYHVSLSGGVVSVTSLGDISQTSVLSTLDGALASGTLVKVYGVPVASSGNGTLKAYVLFYFTGTLPTQ